MTSQNKSIHRSSGSKPTPHTKKQKNEYARAMAIDLLVLVGALLVWALYEHIIPHSWELHTAYYAVEADSGQTLALTLDKETHTYERRLGTALQSSGSYEITGRILRLTESETRYQDSYAMDGDYLASINDIYEGELGQASKFDQTFTHTAAGVTTTIVCTKEQTYTKTVSAEGTETTTQGTYERDGNHIVLTQEGENDSTEELQGLYVYDHKVTDCFYIAG